MWTICLGLSRGCVYICGLWIASLMSCSLIEFFWLKFSVSQSKKFVLSCPVAVCWVCPQTVPFGYFTTHTGTLWSNWYGKHPRTMGASHINASHGTSMVQSVQNRPSWLHSCNTDVSLATEDIRRSYRLTRKLRCDMVFVVETSELDNFATRRILLLTWCILDLVYSQWQRRLQWRGYVPHPPAK